MALERRKKSVKKAATTLSKKKSSAGSSAAARRPAKSKKRIGRAAAPRREKVAAATATGDAHKKPLEIRITKGDMFVPDSPHLGSRTRIAFKVKPKRSVEVKYSGPGRLLKLYHRGRWFCVEDGATYDLVPAPRLGAYEFLVGGEAAPMGSAPKSAKARAKPVARGRAGTINVP